MRDGGRGSNAKMKKGYSEGVSKGSEGDAGEGDECDAAGVDDDVEHYDVGNAD